MLGTLRFAQPTWLHSDQPLEKWWWHLDAIRRREYPAGRCNA